MTGTPIAPMRVPIDLDTHDMAPPPLSFVYRNHRDEFGLRRVLPRQVWFGSTAWHGEPQYFLKAIDLDKHAERDFAVRDIVVFGSIPMEITRLQGRVQELLEANNRYLERARAAEAKLAGASHV